MRSLIFNWHCVFRMFVCMRIFYTYFSLLLFYLTIEWPMCCSTTFFLLSFHTFDLELLLLSFATAMMRRGRLYANMILAEKFHKRLIITNTNVAYECREKKARNSNQSEQRSPVI